MDRRPTIALSAFFLLSALSGCAGRPQAFLLPVTQSVPGASRVDILVATTRSMKDAKLGELFTGERGDALAFADVAVSIPPDTTREIGEVQWPGRGTVDPAVAFATLKAEVIGRDEALRRFHLAVSKTPKRRVLVFVHGYNTRFEEAVYRFAQIAHDSKAPAVPVLFTWPSRGKLFAYTYDRESTNYSRNALESMLQALVRDPAVGEISILAHSMGNWVTFEALRQMGIRNRGIPSKIQNVMLAAPDVDADVFRAQIGDFGPTRPKLTLFVSQDDVALSVSRRIWGDAPRLGAIDPQSEPYKTTLARDGVTVIDLTQLRANNGLKHDKFAEVPEVVRLIGERLVEGQNISDVRLGLGDRIGNATSGAANTVGSAAALVLTAPLTLVDGRTREGFGERVDELGGHVADTVRSGGNFVAGGNTVERRPTTAPP